MTRLSKNFTLNELIKSNTALRHGVDNTPTPEALENLQTLVDLVLQPIADHYRRPVIVNSGYRSPRLNELVKGSRNSQHMKGQAADIEIPGVSNYDLACWIKENLSFDQLILEFYTQGIPDSGWVHVSYVSTTENRHDTRTAEKGVGFRKGLHK